MVVLTVLFFVVAGFELFYWTGGRGLVRIIRPYLMADISDKHYGWSDFIPNNHSRRVSGFYSPQFSNDGVVAIWTFAGLQRFRHQKGTSVYYFRDVCDAVKRIKAAVDEGKPLDKGVPGESVEVILFDLETLKQGMKPEYLVTIQWVEQEGEAGGG